MASRRLEDVASRELLARTLDALTTAEALAVVRAFSYFSLLANIAAEPTARITDGDLRRRGLVPATVPDTSCGASA